MVIKGSRFADFVKFRPYTYPRTPQSLPPLWEAISLPVSKIYKQTNLQKVILNVS